jgi:hypothetical protein
MAVFQRGRLVCKINLNTFCFACPTGAVHPAVRLAEFGRPMKSMDSKPVK